MIAGLLAGFYLVFGVVIPSKLYTPTLQMPAPEVIKNVIPTKVEIQQMPNMLDSGLRRNDKDAASIGQLAYRYEGAPRHQEKIAGSDFVVPTGLKEDVEFWKKIYSQYTSDQAVMHDPDDLGRVYGVIDIPHCDEPPTKDCLKAREDAITAEKERLAEKKWGSAREAGRIRAQVGQRDKFIVGLESSKGVLEKVEVVFEEYGIPVEISRLAFVESMFNTRAYSRSRAAGIWQIMPATARIFGLRVGGKFDERYDPIKSTYVAARHLKRDYNRLGSWDLAINAYNSGPGRIADAVNQLGTKNIVKIIKNYSNPSYGFAARNFYPCFLAVLEVYEGRDKYFYEKTNP